MRIKLWSNSISLKCKICKTKKDCKGSKQKKKLVTAEISGRSQVTSPLADAKILSTASQVTPQAELNEILQYSHYLFLQQIHMLCWSDWQCGVRQCTRKCVSNKFGHWSSTTYTAEKAMAAINYCLSNRAMEVTKKPIFLINLGAFDDHILPHGKWLRLEENPAEAVLYSSPHCLVDSGGVRSVW
jgi:hypothetical protein